MKLKYVYGPVRSWRLGRSLGIDIVTDKKRCTFNCVYCQLGQTKQYTRKRGNFVPVKEIVRELKAMPNRRIDYATFSGIGEPTLASNLMEAIQAVKETLKIPVAVLTNSSLLCQRDVRKALSKADVVMAKLDAPDEPLFRAINKPVKPISFYEILVGIKQFRREFKGKLALQMMFIVENKDFASKMAKLAKELRADEVQINTPLRSCPEPVEGACSVRPLSRKEIKDIKKEFKGLKAITVYDAKRQSIKPFDVSATLLRRPKL